MTTVKLPPRHSLMVDNFHISKIFFTALVLVFVSYLAPAPFLALVAAFTIMLVDTTTDYTAVGKDQCRQNLVNVALKHCLSLIAPSHVFSLFQ